jgi:acylglycerol lipase
MTYRLFVAVTSLVLSACAAAVNPGLRMQRPEDAPQVAGVAWEQTSFMGAGGLMLYAQSWRPAEGTPRGVLVIHHGLADHSSRYEAVAEALAKGGYVVWALDMRGHAHSAGTPVESEHIDDYLGDLDAFLAMVRAREAGLPLFLFGHSLGGLIVGLYAIERQPELAGLITSAPGIAFDAPPIQAALIRLIAGIAGGAPILATPHEDFSASKDVIADMDRDPLIFQGSGPARTARSAVEGTARVWASVARLRVPLLALHGASDKITAPSGSRDLVAGASSVDKTLRIYPGLNHDLLHEPEGKGDQVAADLHAWLDAHTGGPAVSFAATPLTGALKGDAHGRAMSVELEVRGELPKGSAFGGDLGVTAGLRMRLGFGQTTGLGFLAGIDGRAGVLNGGYFELDAHPVGVALRCGCGALVSATAGVGLGGPRGGSTTHVPVELAAEVPSGGVRWLARAAVGWSLSGDGYSKKALGLADEFTALAGVRLGRDVAYWGTVTAGAGPYLALNYRNYGGGQLFGIAFGTELWGGN